MYLINVAYHTKNFDTAFIGIWNSSFHVPPLHISLSLLVHQNTNWWSSNIYIDYFFSGNWFGLVWPVFFPHIYSLFVSVLWEKPTCCAFYITNNIKRLYIIINIIVIIKNWCICIVYIFCWKLDVLSVCERCIEGMSTYAWGRNKVEHVYGILRNCLIKNIFFFIVNQWILGKEVHIIFAFI